MSNPFVVSTAELFRHLGARSPIERRGPLPVALTSSQVADGTDVVADLVLEAQGTTVTATGTVTAEWVGECRRCLTTTGGELVVELSEVFEQDPVEGETYPLGRDNVDLTPALRETIALALPVAPLCDEACAGPDPDAHPVTVEPDEADAVEGEADGAGANGAPKADPRWAALDQLHFDD
jgi:uncharacterized protein